MDIRVYKIENHLAVTGPGTKFIKEELKNYNGRWQPAPFNLWLIPDLKKKTFMKNKEILKKVSIEKQKETKEIEKQTETKELNSAKKFELKTLPDDIIKEVISRLDDGDIASLLSSTKSFGKFIPYYTISIKKQALVREFTHVNDQYRKYYSDKILDLKVNDRVVFNNKNYRILKHNGNKGGEMINVDMLGNQIGDKVIYKIIKHEKEWGCKMINSFYWGTHNSKGLDYKNITEYITSGILLFDNGPEIKNINSHYLKYKTISTKQYYVEPEIGMMVDVYIGIYGGGGIGIDYHREYAITKLYENEMYLEYVGFHNVLDDWNNHRENIAPLLQAIKVNNKWEIVNASRYSIHKIGGFGEYSSEHYPR